MPAYAYKVNIYYGYEVIKTNHECEIKEEGLTVKEIYDIVGDNKFDLYKYHYEYSSSSDPMTISWTTYRLESMEERQRRIEKLEAYNLEVDKRKSK
jgi:hypothetical protein